METKIEFTVPDVIVDIIRENYPDLTQQQMNSLVGDFLLEAIGGEGNDCSMQMNIESYLDSAEERGDLRGILEIENVGDYSSKNF